MLALGACSWDKGPDAPGTPPGNNVATDGSLRGAVVGKYVRFSQGAPYAGEESSLWADTVWRNDRAYSQIALWTEPGTKVTGLTFEFTPLKNYESEIPAEAIRLRSVQYVAGDVEPSVDAQPLPRPEAFIADALAESLPTTIADGEQAYLWLTADIPADCTPGTYTGSLSVLSEGREILSFDIRMLVAPHTLPDPAQWKFHLDLWQFPFQLPSLIESNGSMSVAPLSEAHFDLLRPFYTLLADAGQKAITTYIKDGAFNKGQTMVNWSRTADGSWNFDFSPFDRYIEFMQSLGIDGQINCFSIAGWNNSVGYTDHTGAARTLNLPIGSADFNSTWTAFLSSFRSHLQSKGWFDKAVLFMDENNDADMQKIVNLIRSCGADWKIGLSGRNMTAAIEKELYNYSTIIGAYPSATGITLPIFYTSCSQKHPNNYVTTTTAPAEMTWMAWHAMALGFKGYQRWAFDYWTLSDPLNARDRGNTAGDFSMIYRSGNTTDAKPLSSIRFEMLRDGIQDFEKARILGVNRLSSVLAAFRDINATDATAAVAAAQSQIKKLSVQ